MTTRMNTWWIESRLGNAVSIVSLDFVAPIIAINSTTQDFSWLVLLILHYVGEVLGNSQVIPDLKQDGKKPVPNAGTELGPGRGSSQMLRTLLFLDFSGKTLVLGNGIRECRPLLAS